MSNTGKVYMIISPSNRIYVGSTKRSLKERWWYYYNLHCKNQIRLYNSLIKYGPQNHTFHKIWEGDVKDMYKIEAKYGRLLNVLDHKKGLNCQLPKESNEYACISVETKQKMSNSAKNKPPVSLETIAKRKESCKKSMHITRIKLSKAAMNRIVSQETKDKISKANKGRKMSIEQRMQISLHNTGNTWSRGRKQTEETKLKISNSKKGTIQTKETINKRAKCNNKIIIQLDINDNFIKEWPSIIAASNELKINKSRISECCTGKRVKTKTFKFKFK